MSAKAKRFTSKGRAAAASVPICTEQPGTPWFNLTAGLVRDAPMVIDINPKGVDAMRARGHGRILNVSSTAGFITMSSGYSAIKAWVTNFSEGLSNELYKTGVTVTALCPGWVHTEFHDRAGISKGGIPSWMWLDSERLVRSALRDAERGKVISIPSVRYKVLIWFARHLPRSAVRSISRAISSSRTASGSSSTVTE